MIRYDKDMETEVRSRMREGKGEARLTHVFRSQELGGAARLCALVELEPGSSVGWHRHEGEVEVYYLIQGQGLVNDDGQEREVQAGDAVLTGSGESHSIEAVGQETLRLLALIIPADG